ncbi:hypothetical protein [Serratia marcescens]|uniref:hypothetical protein n=1 Tax=Serratia marcescens TaxID=615 RepID=UPI003204EBB6
MQKVGTVTETADSNGEFTNGNVAQGIPPTILKAEIFNTWQRELVNVVVSSGLTLDPDDDGQVLKAINKLLSLAAAVASVNGKTGEVVINSSDIGLGNVGDFKSVQQGGGANQSNNKVYIGWGNDGLLRCTVDSTDLGQIFTTNSPPSASETGAYPITGGTINGPLNTMGQIAEAGQRVYSPNNQPPIASQAVTGVRLSGRTTQPDTGGHIDLPSGCVYTGMSGANYNPSIWAAYSAIQVNINGTWATVATV